MSQLNIRAQAAVLGSMSDLPEIEALYRVRIDYDEGSNDVALEKISAKAHALADELGVGLDNWRAGPAWNAYFMAESADRAKLEAFLRGICGYIRRFKGAKVW